jgi:hypothetical protein
MEWNNGVSTIAIDFESVCAAHYTLSDNRTDEQVELDFELACSRGGTDA